MSQVLKYFGISAHVYFIIVRIELMILLKNVLEHHMDTEQIQCTGIHITEEEEKSQLPLLAFSGVYLEL